MSDQRVPDFLDRLLARHAPAAAGGRPGVVRVRPRLAGPFERAEAVRGTAEPGPESTAPGTLWPTAAPVPETPGRTEVRLHTERERTVVHTEEHRVEEGRSIPRPALTPVAPQLRPLAPLTPRAVPEATRRTPAPRERGAFANPVSVTAPPATDTAPPAAVSSPLRPSAADTAAARDAVRQAAARRPGRPPEQVVQVQIGRLEVTAGPSQQDGTRQRSPEHGRPATTLSLAEYLTRGRE